jgi:Fe-S cluster biosynthesis and repair protein YggX
MSDRLVKCVKYGKELHGLEQPPFPGALGQRIYESISQQAWNEWQEHSVEVMQAKKLSMGDPQSRKLLMQEMETFLFQSPAAPATPKDAPVAEGMVVCAKIGKPMPRMKQPPFPGALGQRIFENVSEEGFKLWEGQATITMNHYGLSMADPEARKFLMKQMEDFFFGPGAQVPADWIPPGAGGGKGGGGGAGKGAPAPRRK